MPIINFTVKTLDALKAPQEKAQEEYWDQSTPGFGVRISRLSRKVWVVRFKVRGTGEMDRETLGRYEATSLADARIAAREYLDAASRGLNLKRIRQDELRQAQHIQDEEKKTFHWLAELYLEQHAKKFKRSWKEDERILNREILVFWGSDKNAKVDRINHSEGWASRPIKSLKRADVHDLLDRTLKRTQSTRTDKAGNEREGKGIHANRVFALVRKIFNFAIEKGHLDSSPCDRMKRPIQKEESRDRVLTLQEIRTLWKELDVEASNGTNANSIAAIFKLMLLTAQRGNEVKAMEWSEIDFEREIWTIPGSKTKNKKTHTVPLSQQAMTIIRSFLPDRAGSKWVFTSTRATGKHVSHYQKAIQRIRERINIPYVGHDQRRTPATHMAEIGIAGYIIEKIQNHTDGTRKVSAIYNRYSYEAEKREALQKWAVYLDSAIKGRPELKLAGLMTETKSSLGGSEYESKSLQTIRSR